MSRSIKKGPYINKKLVARIEKMNANPADKKVLKTWDRSCTILPSMVGHTISVHNGRKHIPVYVKSEMVGHKLGEFSPTRTFKSHGGVKAIAAKGKKG
jgi:small subunit ribosomal protein S19